MTVDLINQYNTIHKTGVYGNTSIKKAPYILPHILSLKPKSVIDYGCGQSVLIDVISDLGVEAAVRYDPAIERYSIHPQRKFDLLVNVDVLEHIPESGLDAILQDMSSLAANAIIIIDTKIAKTILPNGENAHATVRPCEWWRDKLSAYYPYLEQIKISKNRAAFKTWPTKAHEKPALFFNFCKYRLDHLKWKIANKFQ